MDRRDWILFMMGGGGPAKNRILTTRQPSLLLYYPMDEGSGTTVVNAAPGRSGMNICPNPGFEYLGGGGADIYETWNELANTGTIADELVDVHSGAHAVKLTGGAGADPWVYLHPFIVQAGQPYTWSFWTHGDGVNQGQYRIYDNTNGGYLVAATNTGVAGAVYTLVTVAFTPPVAPLPCVSVQLIFTSPAVAGGIAYFDDVTIYRNTPDPTMFNAVYTGGVTLGQAGYSGLSALFDGANDYIPLWQTSVIPALMNYLPSLAPAGTMLCYGKTTLAALTDAQSHWLFKFKSQVPSHYIDVFKSNTNPGKWGVQFEDDASGAIGNTGLQLATTNWFSTCVTWSVANGLRMYIDGVLLETDAGVTGTWNTASWNNGNLAIGTGLDSGTGWWPGWLQHFAIWDAELTPAEVRRIAQI